MTHLPDSSLYQNIRIVLVNTSHPGNIGAVARAMKNMGLSRLYLVEPKDFPSLESIRRSAGAVDILDEAVVVDDLSQAISGCVWVAGTSARLRTIEWPILEPEACVATAIEYAEAGDVAIVFGRENSGLTNHEMEKCHALLHIPTNPEYSSLNLAAAVQVVAYEIRLALEEGEVIRKKGNKHYQDVIADTDQLEGMYMHLHESLQHINFFGTNNPEVMMRRLKGLFNRAQMTQREVSIMRGICTAMQDKKRER